ncbi:MAG: hypothetical protein F6K35_21795, partial [Okeania sp. SIO2H7]|nr:hypothetical protein [Okeania sp. SIO2H7]
MEYVFNAEAEALRNAGQLEPVISQTGEVLPLLKNPTTGEFVVAKGVSNSSEIGTIIEITKAVVDFAQPLISPTEIVANVVAQMLEKEGGDTAVLNSLNSVQSSLGVLQTTTALIGVGTVAGAVLSAVNLHQTLKLREDVKQL